MQFEKEEDAKKSVDSENGSLLKGSRLGEFCSFGKKMTLHEKEKTTKT